jgi:hypothetical protein
MLVNEISIVEVCLVNKPNNTLVLIHFRTVCATVALVRVLAVPVCDLYWGPVVSSVSKQKCRKIVKMGVDKPSIVSR